MNKVKLYFVLFLVGTLVVSTSCTKTKIRKRIAGTWKFESLTHNGVEDDREISGAYSFDECSVKDNNNDGCSVRQVLNITSNGQSINSDIITVYKVLDDEKILMGDVEYDVDISLNKLILTNSENGTVSVTTLIK